MKSSLVALACAIAALSCAAPLSEEAAANGWHKSHTSHNRYVAKHRRHAHPARPRHTRYGYGRPGPRHGYGFGFSTYAGDPFYGDDYFDGRGCYYLHRQDFCRGRKSLDWLRFR